MLEPASIQPLATPSGIIAATDGFRRRLFKLAAWCSLSLALLGTAGTFVDVNNRSTFAGLLTGTVVTVLYTAICIWQDAAYALFRRSPETLVAMSLLVLGMFAINGGWRNSLFAATSAPIFFAAVVAGVRWSFVVAGISAGAYLSSLYANALTVGTIEASERSDLVLANAIAYFFAALLISVPAAWMGRFLPKIHQFMIEHSAESGASVEQSVSVVDSDAKRRIEALTARELEVLHLLAAGQSDREIATALGLSPKTIQNHVAKMRDRTDTRSRTELVTLGIRGGIIPIGTSTTGSSSS